MQEEQNSPNGNWFTNTQKNWLIGMLAFMSIFSLVLNLQGNSLLTPQKSKADAFSSIVNAIRECQERAAVLADAMSAYQQVKSQDNSGGNTLEVAENNMNNAVAAFEGCQYLTE